MTKVAVLDDYQGVALQMADWSSLPAEVEVRVFTEHLSDASDLVSRLRDFEIVSCMRERTPFGSDVLSRLPNLRLLVTTGRGNAAIDLDAATGLGIVVCGTDGLGYPTAELTWGLILALVRNIPQEVAAVRGGGWQTAVGGDLNGKTLGILGLGRLGSRVAAIGLAFEMSVIAWSQNLTADVATQHGAALVSRDELFARSDVLSIHLVLGARTRGLVGRARAGADEADGLSDQHVARPHRRRVGSGERPAGPVHSRRGPRCLRRGAVARGSRVATLGQCRC